ncbi:MAG: hypothetical protein SFV15_04480 [Polyangiaceae bacterium]|nr:hypothetical protein [Polyangiaceae bacterium]
MRYALQGSLVALALVASAVSGCSDDSGAASGSGGAKASGGASSGGTNASTGGKVATTGGASSGGASAATGGQATGGAAVTGGSSASGGSAATGGAAALGGSAATGGAATGGGAIGTAACTLPDADASAMGKTCVDYCEGWLGPGGSCHDMEGFMTTYVDDIDQSDCRTKCAAFTQSQFCCRMQHVLLSVAAIPANWENAQPADFAEEIVHCGHAAGTTLCQN